MSNNHWHIGIEAQLKFSNHFWTPHQHGCPDCQEKPNLKRSELYNPSEQKFLIILLPPMRNSNVTLHPCQIELSTLEHVEEVFWRKRMIDRIVYPAVIKLKALGVVRFFNEQNWWTIILQKMFHHPEEVFWQKRTVDHIAYWVVTEMKALSVVRCFHKLKR